MPFDKERYPANWDDISRRIRNRDGWKCKWCGVENGAVGSRDKKGRWYSEAEIIEMDDETCYELFGQQAKRIKIVLTVAHLGVDKPGQPGSGDVHDKMDCRDENLESLCQKCHLNYDRNEHIINAAATRRRRKIEAGQIEMRLDTGSAG